MTNDEIQAVREFRAGIAPPSEEARRRIYAYATGRMDRVQGRPRFWGQRFLPSTSPRLVAALAGAAICAAAAAVVATGTFTGGATHAATHAVGHSTSLGGDQSPGPMSITYSSNGGTLSSVAVSLNPNLANATVQMQVLHSDASSAAEVKAASAQVVYQNQVATSAPAASSFGLSTWSGTLSPSNWSGGCQAGFYQIKWLAVGPGTSFANASAAPSSETGASEWFSCSGS